MSEEGLIIGGEEDLERELLRKRVELLHKEIEAIKAHGLEFYVPHAKQLSFHAASEFRSRAVFAGNRFGKSWMGCAEDCAWLEGERPFVPKTSPLRRLGIPQRPLKGLVITTDWDKVDEIFTSVETGKLWKLLPRDFIKRPVKNHSGVYSQLFCANGSSLTFDTVQAYKTNKQGAESSDWDFIHVDEPCPEAMFKAHSRGLIDRMGSEWFTLTPLSEPWIVDKFFPDGTKGKEGCEFVGPDGRLLRWAVMGSTRDNTFLTKEAIDDYEATLTSEERDCRLRGIPMFLSGLIYKEFDFDKHVLKKVPKGWADFNTPPAHYTLYYAIDPHPKTPHAVLFCAVSEFGQRFYFDEIFEHCSIDELSRKVLQVRNRFLVCGREICDPLAFIENPTDERSMADVFAENGIFVEKAIKDPTTGILQVKKALSGSDEVYFSPNLVRTLWEFKHYIWDEARPNKPKDENDHTMEDLYRLELIKPTFIEDTSGKNTSVDDVVIDRAELGLADIGLTDV